MRDWGWLDENWSLGQAVGGLVGQSLNGLYIVVVGETRVSGSLSLTEVASELGPETLQRLKRECGGLQTLLRNNHQVFEGKGIGP